MCCRVCVWSAFLLILLAIFNACNIITRFTRIAGELFGMLITVLFFQEAIKVLIASSSSPPSKIDCEFGTVVDHPDKLLFEPQGVIGEFSKPTSENPSPEEFQFHWRYTNGLLSVIFSFGVLLTSLKSRRARQWLYGTSK